MSYRPYTDGIFYGIEESDEEPDGDEFFRTFTEAKKAVVRELRLRASDYLFSARQAARMKLEDVEKEES